MGRSNKSNQVDIGDLVWCVCDIYKLPVRGVVVKVIELNPIYNSIDYHYEILIDDEIYTLHETEVYHREDSALSFQIMQLKGYDKF